MFKTRRQGRYDKLRDNGFTTWEAKALSTIGLTVVPYMRDMVRQRNQLFQQWYASGEITSKSLRQDIYRVIREWYIGMGFVIPGTEIPDVWRYLRWVEEQFADKYPSYTSPNRRKSQGFVPFSYKR